MLEKKNSPSLQDLPGDDLCTLSVAELTAGYASGVLSPVAVAERALERAEHAQQLCNAFTLIDHDGARAAAAASEARWRAGAPASAIDGVPGTIKDIVSVRGWPISYGSRLVSDVPCPNDAPSVTHLRAGGMVLLGCTTTPEFGWKALTDSPRWGITRNPWNTSLTPGGSSGGAAAAAALGAGVLHLGSDGAGSIRIPAAFTGTSGIKPTFGRVPAYPPSAFGTVAHIGPMARRIEDAQAMLQVMSGRDLRDWFQGAGALDPLAPQEISPRGLRIGIWKTPPCGDVHPEIAAAFEAALEVLRAAGAVLEEIDLPFADELYHMSTTLWYCGARARLEGFGAIGSLAREDIDPGVMEIAEQVAGMTASDYVALVNRRAEYGAAMDQLAERHAFILSPTASILPFEAGHEVPPGSGLDRWFRWAGFSFPINLSQQPAAAVPTEPSTQGVPHSLQIIGPRGADMAVLALARWWQQRCPPPLAPD